MSDDRDLDWDGCYNVRDLGGLRTVDGRVTRSGALVRSDAPSALTASGWAAMRTHGIATVIDLVEDHERRPDAAPRPPELIEVRVPLDGTDDEDFWAPLRANGHWGTVLYYRPYLERFPHRIAAAARAFADAPPGGVLVHCGRGRDRTGLVSMILLSLVGVRAADIADDYARSDGERVVRLQQLLGLPPDNTKTEEIYAAAG
ncbi:MAG TPA: tyrosine-protein phosphatase, partial [Micromonosporaceae bacterium]